jgi:ligand-binding SRPBCC domain-containing protein
MQRTLTREQWLPIPIEEAWAFFSTPLNLAKITPRDMGFVIREPFDHGAIREGQLITYTVRPLLGIPLTWVTRIDAAEAPHRFVDTQLKGPYTRWWHEHTFMEKDGGTLMKDRVEYELPLGPLGELMHALVVKDKLKAIFDFRFRTLEQFFPVQRSTRSELV